MGWFMIVAVLVGVSLARHFIRHGAPLGGLIGDGLADGSARSSLRRLRRWAEQRGGVIAGDALVVPMSHGGAATFQAEGNEGAPSWRASTHLHPLSLPTFLARATQRDGSLGPVERGDVLSARMLRSYEVLGDHHGILRRLSVAVRSLPTSSLSIPEIEVEGDRVSVLHPVTALPEQLAEDLLALLDVVAQLPASEFKTWFDEPITIERWPMRVQRAGSRLREQRIAIMSPSIQHAPYLTGPKGALQLVFEGTLPETASALRYDGLLEGRTATPALPPALRPSGTGDALIALVGVTLVVEDGVVALTLPSDASRTAVDAADRYLAALGVTPTESPHANARSRQKHP